MQVLKQLKELEQELIEHIQLRKLKSFFRDFFRQAGGQYSNRTGQQGYGNYGNYNGGYIQSAYVDKKVSTIKY